MSLYIKRICTLIAGLFMFSISYSQSITEVYFPQYIQGVGTGRATDDKKTPYACRLTINGLAVNTTYHYYNRFVTDKTSTSTGVGYLYFGKAIYCVCESYQRNAN